MAKKESTDSQQDLAEGYWEGAGRWVERDLGRRFASLATQERRKSRKLNGRSW